MPEHHLSPPRARPCRVNSPRTHHRAVPPGNVGGFLVPGRRCRGHVHLVINSPAVMTEKRQTTENRSETLLSRVSGYFFQKLAQDRLARTWKKHSKPQNPFFKKDLTAQASSQLGPFCPARDFCQGLEPFLTRAIQVTRENGLASLGQYPGQGCRALPRQWGSPITSN